MVSVQTQFARDWREIQSLHRKKHSSKCAKGQLRNNSIYSHLMTKDEFMYMSKEKYDSLLVAFRYWWKTNKERILGERQNIYWRNKALLHKSDNETYSPVPPGLSCLRDMSPASPALSSGSVSPTATSLLSSGSLTYVTAACLQTCSLS